MNAVLRKRVPMPLRIAVASVRRHLRDRQSGATDAMAQRRLNEAESPVFSTLVSVRQPIMMTAYYEGKVTNIRLGASLLNGVVVEPGEIFSFWNLIGRPLASAGFAMGRAIREDVLQGDLGGGLCQVSGLAYELGLRAGFEVLERHPHSRDLYAEEERFTLLGLDATVVWPWKDLRLRNGHSTPVCMQFAVGDGWIEGRVLAQAGLQAFELDVERTEFADSRKVHVSRRPCNGECQWVSSDTYIVDIH
ncbi:MAG: VanW family protein [Novosphingobium sp.]